MNTDHVRVFAFALTLAALASGCPAPTGRTWPTVWGEVLPACCYDADGGDTADDTGEDTGQAGPDLEGQVGPALGAQARPL
jgi:hypothetical protein